MEPSLSGPLCLGMFSHAQRLYLQDLTGRRQAIVRGLSHKDSLDLMCC